MKRRKDRYPPRSKARQAFIKGFCTWRGKRSEHDALVVAKSAGPDHAHKVNHIDLRVYRGLQKLYRNPTTMPTRLTMVGSQDQEQDKIIHEPLPTAQLQPVFYEQSLSGDLGFFVKDPA